MKTTQALAQFKRGLKAVEKEQARVYVVREPEHRSLEIAAEEIRDVRGLFEAYDALAGELERWREDEIPATTPCPTGNPETIEPIRNQERAVACIREKIRAQFEEALDDLDKALAGIAGNRRA